MPATNPRIAPILTAHPNENVVVCVAGCGGKPRAVQILPRVVGGRSGRYVPSAGEMGQEVYGPPRPGRKAMGKLVDTRDDVICVAGCIGRPGQILQRMTDLPTPKSVSGKTQKAPAKADKAKRNGLLDALP